MKLYKIVDNDGEPITFRDYDIINSVITKSFPRFIKAPVFISNSSAINVYKENDSGAIIHINYLQTKSQVKINKNSDIVKRNFELKTKLRLEEIN